MLRIIVSFLVAVLCASALPAAERPPVAAAAEGLARPTGVSPGGLDAFHPGDACPTFSWATVAGARGYELVVYPVAKESGKPSLEALLPAGASSWTPAADRCLTPGERYGWSVRAATETDRVRGEWSEALLFEVASAPTATELQRALEVVRRYLETARVGEQGLGTAVADILLTREVAAPDLPEPRQQAPAGGRPATALRGEVPDVAGETYGVRGVAHSPDGAGVRADNLSGAGPDLVLDGSPPAEVTESGLSRDSASNLTFNFSNPGAGTMTLQMDGNAVVTAGSGSNLWVDETGDLMTGTLTLDPAAGFALETAGGDAINLGGNLFKGGTLFLHDNGAHSTAVGAGALAANTVSGNTAVGYVALAGNTTGLANTAVGAYALNANTTGTNNAALGGDALSANIGGSQNTALGRSALPANTLGSSNVAVGYAALYSSTGAFDNTAVGTAALSNVITGSSNTAVGRSALLANTANLNTAVGAFALDSNSTGSNNTAVGVFSLGANTMASNNTAVGAGALDANTTGTSNTALGKDALGSNTTGINNTAVGRNALFAETTGGGNTAVGAYALDENTAAVNNTAVGISALGSNASGPNNTAVGASALLASTAGYNTALGATALDSNATGVSNTAVGYHALADNVTGGNNIALGASAGANATGSNNIYLGNAGLAAESGTLRIGTAGTQTSTFIAGIHGETSPGGLGVFINASGELGTTTSSRRFKRDIRDVGPDEGRILALRPVSFRYQEEAPGQESPIEYGLVAEEVAEVFPELVAFDAEDQPFTVRYHLLVPLLLHELQRQHQINEEQSRRLAAQQAALQALARRRH